MAKLTKTKDFIQLRDWGFDDLLLNVLYSYFYGWDGDCFTSNKKLSQMFYCGETTIKNKIKWLIENGYIQREITNNNRRRYIKVLNKGSN